MVDISRAVPGTFSVIFDVFMFFTRFCFFFRFHPRGERGTARDGPGTVPGPSWDRPGTVPEHGPDFKMFRNFN